MNLSSKLLVLLTIIIATGCASITGYHQPAKDEASVNKLITYKHDEFTKTGWLSTADYLGQLEGEQRSGVTHSYRALYDSSNKLISIQIYMTLMTSDWFFINNVLDTNDSKFKFIAIDRQVMSSKVVHETFAIEINKDQLKEFAKNDLRLKIIGKRYDGIFTVSKHLSAAFLNSINMRNAP